MVDSGMVQLKPERRDLYSEKPELEPVWLHCDMEAEGGIGVTVVGKQRCAHAQGQEFLKYGGPCQYFLKFMRIRQCKYLLTYK